MAMDSIPTGAAPRIAIVTRDESVQLAAQELLASAFHTTLLDSGEQILPLLDEVSLEALILDLEAPPASDHEMLRLIRRLREHDEHLVLLGFTRSHNKAARNQFEQAGIATFSSRRWTLRKCRVSFATGWKNEPRKSRTAGCGKRLADETRFVS